MLNRITATIFAITLAAGCSVNVEPDVKEDLEVAKKGPEALPGRNVTDFTQGLRCMDNLFLVYGIGDLTVLIEDLKDNTDQVNAGTRDMVISTISDMTKRSQAVQIITYGSDTGNLISFLQAAEQKSVYDNIPPFDIRGSISQLDKDIIRKSKSFGANVGGTIDGNPFGFDAGKANAASGTVLGLDLSIITTHNMAVIPGVTSRNSVVVFKSDKATDIEGGLVQKFGINYRFSALRNEGVAQALRALIELATMELFGKLVKVPYWKCLGVEPNHPDIRNEISDWFYSMTANGTIHQYLKTQLYIRGYYQGPLDDIIDEAYQYSILKYKERLGINTGPGVDLDFFSAFLNTTPTNIPPSELAYNRPKWELPSERKKSSRKQQNAANQANRQGRNNDSAAQAATVAAVAQPEPQPVVDPKMRVNIRTGNDGAVYSRGEPVDILVQSNADGYIYCFFQDANNEIVRFFPNRFTRDGFVSAQGQVVIPGDMPFTITANAEGRQENVFCFITAENIMTSLPDAVRRADFEPLGVDSQAEVATAFRQATNNRLGEGMLTIKSQ